MNVKDKVTNVSLLQEISVASSVISLVLLVLLHIIEPEFDPTWQFISEYSLGKFGFLMNIVFFGFSISLFSFGMSLFKNSEKVTTRISIALIFLSALGMFLAALFNTDPFDTPMEKISFSGMMHFIGGQLNLTPFAALFAAFGLKKHFGKKESTIQWIIIACIFIFVVGFIITAALSQGVFKEGVYTAIFGRLMLLFYFVWQIFVIYKVEHK